VSEREAEIWRKYDAMESRLSAGLSERMIDLADLRSGMRVLDIGTGRGEPAIPAARRVSPGVVVGIDSSEQMLHMARHRADSEGITNLELHVANAESIRPPLFTGFHAALARWVLMYVDRPVQAMSAIRSSLLPGGRLVCAMWAEPARVPYDSMPRKVLMRHLSVPAPNEHTPGTFRYSSIDQIRTDYASAGFLVDHIEEMEVAVMEAATDADLIAWVRAFGWSRLLAGVSESIQLACERDLIAEAAQYRRDGTVRLGGVARIVVGTARS
jgi:ubiquinone/menaquinone biosynthesis C-methylase UbiE